jgi:PKD repeat protein
MRAASAVMAKRRGGPAAWEIYATIPSDSFTATVTTYGAVNFIIDWGDGTVEVKTQSAGANWAHVYASAGDYTLKLSGIASQLNVSYTTAFRSCVTGCSPMYGILGANSTKTLILTQLFLNNTNFLDIPDGMFDPLLEKGVKLTYTNQAWQGAAKLRYIPNDLCRNHADLVNASLMFHSCSASNLTWPRRMFKDCTALTNIRELCNIARYLGGTLKVEDFEGSGITTLYGSFQGTALTAIETGMFDAFDGQIANVFAAFNTYYPGSTLTGQSYKFWDWATPPSVTDDCYKGCTTLDDYATIPAAYL